MSRTPQLDAFLASHALFARCPLCNGAQTIEGRTIAASYYCAGGAGRPEETIERTCPECDGEGAVLADDAPPHVDADAPIELLSALSPIARAA